jgi:CRP-like cAMP-binding protein
MRPVQQQSSIGNRLLAALSPQDFALLQPYLEPIDFKLGDTLIEPNTPIAHVYFPQRGMASITNNSHDGKIEVGVIGREGMIGIPILLGADRCPYEFFMQIEGRGLRISAQQLEKAVVASPSLRRLFLRYVQAMSIQTSQTAFANANNMVEARLARWLLMCHDRVEGNDIPLTHALISIMLGVRRAGVTVALHLLEGNKLIRAKRGLITILDREKLEELADDAYGLAEAEYTRLMSERA